MRYAKTISSLVMLAISHVAVADISVVVGPTEIRRGDAQAAKDITINNGVFAIGIAVETAPPWGIARGGIVDIALVKNGEVGYDIASLADFMPDKWSSWPTTYQEVTLEDVTDESVTVRTKRDWGTADLVTTFDIRSGSNVIRIHTTMTNNGEETLDDMHTGYVVWPDGGSLFGMPGLPAVEVSESSSAMGEWSASYGEDWALGLHASFAGIVAYGGRDRYLAHELAPGESRSFEAWLQIEGSGSLAPFVANEIARLGLPAGSVHGSVVSADGQSVSEPAVIVTREGLPFTWALGKNGQYALDLPVGSYEISATARGYAQGGLQSIAVKAGSELEVNFDDVRPPGSIEISVLDAESGDALDARISINDGYKPIIGHFGKNTFFTEVAEVGRTTESIAPGRYVLQVSSGGGFTSQPQIVEVDVEPGKTAKLTVEIPVLARPANMRWYNADLHHHSDVLDGFTEAEYVFRSELASGVDLTFLSDHNSVTNNARLLELSSERGRLFIAGTEMSPSWAHFNVYPLDDGRTVDIDTGQAPVQEIFAAARDMGADVIEVNHPYSEYGYFTSVENGRVPGGYDGGFDLVEMTSGNNQQTLEHVWQMWNEGTRVYLAGGSDVHDVWLETSGGSRTYAYVEGELSVDAFIASVKAGHSFATQGPLVFPEILFGSEVRQTEESLQLKYKVQAVSGLKAATLIERGQMIDAVSLSNSAELVSVDFRVNPVADTWYQLIVEDINGRFAYTNPVWVKVAD